MSGNKWRNIVAQNTMEVGDLLINFEKRSNEKYMQTSMQNEQIRAKYFSNENISKYEQNILKKNLSKLQLFLFYNYICNI